MNVVTHVASDGSEKTTYITDVPLTLDSGDTIKVPLHRGDLLTRVFYRVFTTTRPGQPVTYYLHPNLVYQPHITALERAVAMYTATYGGGTSGGDEEDEELIEMKQTLDAAKARYQKQLTEWLGVSEWSKLEWLMRHRQANVSWESQSRWKILGKLHAMTSKVSLYT